MPETVKTQQIIVAIKRTRIACEYCPLVRPYSEDL